MNDPYYIKTQEKVYNITEDETFVGYESEIVENPTGTLVEKTITENGEYLPASDNADGYSKVMVEVPIPTSKLPQMIDRTITEITAEDLGSITKIGRHAFASCSDLLHVTLPITVTKIEYWAFNFCTSLVSIDIPNNLQIIENQVFQMNSALTSLDLPSTITTIGSAAFASCTSLTGITIRAINPPVLQSYNAFNDTNNCPIYVPAESVEAYKTATNWANLASRIQAIPE